MKMTLIPVNSLILSSHPQRYVLAYAERLGFNTLIVRMGEGGYINMGVRDSSPNPQFVFQVFLLSIVNRKTFYG